MKLAILLVMSLLLSGCSLITIKGDLPEKFKVIEHQEKDGTKWYEVELPKQ